MIDEPEVRPSYDGRPAHLPVCSMSVRPDSPFSSSAVPAPGSGGADSPESRVDRIGDARVLVRKMAIGLLAMFVVAGLSGLLLREPLVQIGGWCVTRFGIAGLFVATWVTDTSPLPLTNEPLMFLALGGGMGRWTIFAVVSAASVLGGASGYFFGRTLHRFTRVHERMTRWSPDVVSWLEKNGAWGVAVAALTPIPYSLSTWTAGIIGTRFSLVMLAALLRIPKTAFYLLLLIAGWELGTHSVS